MLLLAVPVLLVAEAVGRMAVVRACRSAPMGGVSGLP